MKGKQATRGNEEKKTGLSELVFMDVVLKMATGMPGSLGTFRLNIF